MVGSCTFTVKEKLALPVLFLASFAVTVYRVGAFTSVGVITRFIQLSLLLPPLMKLMGQSRRGVSQALEAQHPLVMATPKFIQLSMPLPQSTRS
jgi:hypothetical protein